MHRSTIIMIQFALLLVNPTLLLAQIAIVLSGVHPENTICLPSSACHWSLLFQVAIACAALPAAISLFRKAYYSCHQSTSALFGSAFDDRGGIGVATWAMGGVQSCETAKSTGSRLSGEGERRQLGWLFQDSHGIEDELVRDLILRNTGAWDCTALPQNHPLELLDFDVDA